MALTRELSPQEASHQTLPPSRVNGEEAALVPDGQPA
jgi:hypothetical protein